MFSILTILSIQVIFFYAASAFICAICG